jgi:hypothetical protein
MLRMMLHFLQISARVVLLGAAAERGVPHRIGVYAGQGAGSQGMTCPPAMFIDVLLATCITPPFVTQRAFCTQELIHTQQYYHWLHYRANRLKAAAALQQEQAQVQPETERAE